MKRAGALALRGEEPLDGYCPIERSLGVVGTRSAILLLREAFYGATRFDEFVARSGLTDSTTAGRLRELVDAGVMRTRPYQEAGQRRRDEYLLTEAGRDLMPALFALLQWANRYDAPPYPPELTHDGCGAAVTIEARCDRGHLVTDDEVTVSAPGPFGLTDPAPARP